MKYIILVPDGAADYPIAELGNKTVMEAANTRFLDILASYGKMGLLQTIPKDMHPGSEVGNMTIMGYDPRTELPGRGPLEALSAGVPMGKEDIVFRCNLVTIEKGIMIDYSAGHISTDEGKRIIEDINKELGEKGVSFYPGVQYRHILKLDGKIFSDKVICTPPHDIIGKKAEEFTVKPNGIGDKEKRTADKLNILIERSEAVLLEHPVNVSRREKRKRPATHIWPWGGGKRPSIPPMKERYGIRGAVISAVDLIFGLGIAIGLKPIRVKGATGLPDTNYEGKADAAVNALKNYDYVYVHVEATDEMGHAGDYAAKKSALEDFDTRLVGRIIKRLTEINDEITLVCLPDHYTPCSLRTHSGEAVPFLIFRGKCKELKEITDLGNPTRGFTEKNGAKGELGILENGKELMNLILADNKN